VNGSGYVPATPESPTGLRIHGTDQVFELLPPVPWLCQSLRLAPGAPTLVAGYGYAGKTLSMQALSLSVASGVLVWGRYVCKTGRVLHLDYEQGSRLTFDRYQRLARGMGLSLADLHGRLEVGNIPEVKLDPDLLLRIAHHRDLILVDSWRAAHEGVDENSSEVRSTLDAMTRASERTGCTFIVLLHARKASKDATGGKSQSIRGSSGFFDGCQTAWLFDGTTVGAPVVSLEKDRLEGSALAPFTLRFLDQDGRLGLKVSVEDGPAEAVPATGAEKLAETMALLRRLVVDRPGLSGNAIAEVTEKRRAHVTAALQSLVTSGEIRVEGTGAQRGYYPPSEVPFDG
jgi:hypothetical protein